MLDKLAGSLKNFEEVLFMLRNGKVQSEGWTIFVQLSSQCEYILG